MKTRILDVPPQFFKNKPFPCTEEELRLFYKNFVGYTQGNDLILVELDIDSIVKYHSGDCRLWLKTECYDVLDCNRILMKVEYYEFYEDIYEWMKDKIPTLYEKHIDYDTRRT